MNTTATEANEAKLIPFDPRLIDPSPYQPRRLYDPKKMAELEDSIREIGLIQPLVVRVSPVDPGRMELIVGERRLRSSIGAGLTVVPTLLRVVNDTIAEKMVLEENLQRADLTVSEEGRAFARLLAMRDAAGNPVYTQSSLAEFIHKDSEYITARLRLVICPEELITAVDEGVIAVSVALLVGGIPDAKARQACAKEVLTPEIIDQQVPLNFAQTRELIREHFCVKLDAKRFDLDDPNLVPVATGEDGQRCYGGACSDCPFRSGNMEGVVLRKSETTGDGGKKKGTTSGAISNLCTLPKCFKFKLDAQWQRVKAEKKDVRTLEGAAAKKVFSGRDGGVAFDNEYMALDEARWIEGLNTLATPRSVLKGKKFEVVLAQHPETRQIIELISKTELKAQVKAKEGEKPKSNAELLQEEESKTRRKEEIKNQKIEKLALAEGIAEIRTAVSTGRVKVDETFCSMLFDTALDAAGSDGLKFIADTLEIERDKKAGGYGLDQPVKAWVRKHVETVPQWFAIITFAMLARKVPWNGMSCEHFRAALGLCGLKVDELKRRAKALLSPPKKGSAEKYAPTADRNSSDKDNWTVEGEASTTAAADKLAKDAGIVRKGAQKGGKKAAAE